MAKPFEIIQLERAISNIWFDFTVNDYNEVIELEIGAEEYEEPINFNENFEVITAFKKLRKLAISISNFNNLSPLATLSDLEWFEANECDIKSVDMLKGLSKLRHLSLYLNGITDISSLRECDGLEYLNLSCNNISDISVLSGMARLKQLSLSHNKIGDASALQNSKRLESLYISHNFLEDISSIAGNSDLMSLDVSHNKIKELLFINNFENLTTLNFSDNGVVDVSFISSLQNLTQLNISGNNITEISSLAALENGTLHSLQLSRNCISDAGPVAHLTRLISFSAGSNPIADISFIAHFKDVEQLELDGVLKDNFWVLKNKFRLKMLSLRCNNITNVPILPGINALQNLILSGNRIEDVSPLLKYEGLNFLDISHNAIKNPATLMWLPALRTLDLRGNPVAAPGFNAVFSDDYYVEGRLERYQFNLTAARYYLQQNEYDKALAYFLLSPSRYTKTSSPDNDSTSGLLEIYYHKFLATNPSDHYYLRFYFIKCVTLLNTGGTLPGVVDVKKSLITGIKNLPDAEALTQSLTEKKYYAYNAVKAYWHYTQDTTIAHKLENPIVLFETGKSVNRDDIDYGISNYRRLVRMGHPLQHTLKMVLLNIMDMRFAYTEEERLSYRQCRAKLDVDNFMPLFDRFGLIQKTPVQSVTIVSVKDSEEPFVVKLFYGFVKAVFILALLAVVYFTIVLLHHSR